MSEAKSTLDKVMEVLGMQAPVAAEEPAVVLAEEEVAVAPEAPAAEAPAEEAPKASVEEKIDALDAKILALTEMVSKMVAEVPAVAEVPMVPVPTAMSKQEKLSAQPKFNGAPMEAPKNVDAVKLKVDGTMGTVLARLYGN